MPASDDIQAMYAQFIALSREAFASGHLEMAYHALAGAMHAARGAGNAGWLAQVEAMASEQLAWVDAHDPDNRLSTISARRRGTQLLWTTLSHEAATSRKMAQTTSRLASPAYEPRPPVHHEGQG